MTMLGTAERLEGHAGPCPGPVPASAAHAETCAACGKCGVVSRFLDRQFAEARDAIARSPRQALA